MTDLHDLIADEKHIIECSPLSEATKVGQVYCYLSSGPTPMIKIGKGKNGRQRMASWLKEYPPSWRDGQVVFLIDKMNQSTGETGFHRFFANQRVPSDSMMRLLGLENWQRLPDGASEWFYCDTFVKDTFRSVGIDLVSIYRSRQDYAPTPIQSVQVNRSRGFLYTVARKTRQTLGFLSLVLTVSVAIATWGSWVLFGILVFLGIMMTGAILPEED